jgi:hypothetical protein
MASLTVVLVGAFSPRLAREAKILPFLAAGSSSVEPFKKQAKEKAVWKALCPVQLGMY